MPDEAQDEDSKKTHAEEDARRGIAASPAERGGGEDWRARRDAMAAREARTAAQLKAWYGEPEMAVRIKALYLDATAGDRKACLALGRTLWDRATAQWFIRYVEDGAANWPMNAATEEREAAFWLEWGAKTGNRRGWQRVFDTLASQRLIAKIRFYRDTEGALLNARENAEVHAAALRGDPAACRGLGILYARSGTDEGVAAAKIWFGKEREIERRAWAWAAGGFIGAILLVLGMELAASSLGVGFETASFSRQITEIVAAGVAATGTALSAFVGRYWDIPFIAGIISVGTALDAFVARYLPKPPGKSKIDKAEEARVITKRRAICIFLGGVGVVSFLILSLLAFALGPDTPTITQSTPKAPWPGLTRQNDPVQAWAILAVLITALVGFVIFALRYKPPEPEVPAAPETIPYNPPDPNKWYLDERGEYHRITHRSGSSVEYVASTYVELNIDRSKKARNAGIHCAANVIAPLVGYFFFLSLRSPAAGAGCGIVIFVTMLFVTVPMIWDWSAAELHMPPPPVDLRKPRPAPPEHPANMGGANAGADPGLME